MIERYVDILPKTLELAWRDRVDRPIHESNSFESPDIISIEPYAWALAAHVLEKPSSPPASAFLPPLTLHQKTKVIDSLGHARRVYRGLAFHAAQSVGIDCNMADLKLESLSHQPISPSIANIWLNVPGLIWMTSSGVIFNCPAEH